jgi:peptidoglycan DL-endopeptidase LytF
MTDEVFRWAVTAGVALAAVAMVVQAIVLASVARAVRKLQANAEPLIERAGPLADQAKLLLQKAAPVIEKAGPLMESARQAVEKAGPAIQKAGPLIEKIGILNDKVGLVVEQAGELVVGVTHLVDDSRPRFAEISNETVAIVKTGREQAEKMGELLQDAAGRARTRLDQIDRSLDSTVAQVEQAGESVKRAVMRPVREVNGVAAGISAAVSSLVRKKAPVDEATQDEEMFI